MADFSTYLGRALDMLSSLPSGQGVSSSMSMSMPDTVLQNPEQLATDKWYNDTVVAPFNTLYENSFADRQQYIANQNINTDAINSGLAASSGGIYTPGVSGGMVPGGWGRSYIGHVPPELFDPSKALRPESHKAEYGATQISVSGGTTRPPERAEKKKEKPGTFYINSYNPDGSLKKSTPMEDYGSSIPGAISIVRREFNTAGISPTGFAQALQQAAFTRPTKDVAEAERQLGEGIRTTLTNPNTNATTKKKLATYFKVNPKGELLSIDGRIYGVKDSSGKKIERYDTNEFANAVSVVRETLGNRLDAIVDNILKSDAIRTVDVSTGNTIPEYKRREAATEYILNALVLKLTGKVDAASTYGY